MFHCIPGKIFHPSVLGLEIITIKGKMLTFYDISVITIDINIWLFQNQLYSHDKQAVKFLF